MTGFLCCTFPPQKMNTHVPFRLFHKSIDLDSSSDVVTVDSFQDEFMCTFPFTYRSKTRNASTADFDVLLEWLNAESYEDIVYETISRERVPIIRLVKLHYPPPLRLEATQQEGKRLGSGRKS